MWVYPFLVFAFKCLREPCLEDDEEQRQARSKAAQSPGRRPAFSFACKPFSEAVQQAYQQSLEPRLGAVWG